MLNTEKLLIKGGIKTTTPLNSVAALPRMK